MRVFRLNEAQILFAYPPYLRNSVVGARGEVLVDLEIFTQDEIHNQTWAACLHDGRLMWVRKDLWKEGPGPLVEEL